MKTILTNKRLMYPSLIFRILTNQNAMLFEKDERFEKPNVYSIHPSYCVRNNVKDAFDPNAKEDDLEIWKEMMVLNLLMPR